MDAAGQTFPEILAGDLARSQDIFRSRSLTAGSPAAPLALESQPPQVPRRNPGRAVTSTLHRTTSETALCSPRATAGARADTARRQQQQQQQDIPQDEWPLRGPGPRLSSLPGKRQDHMFAIKEIDMTRDGNKDSRRLFLNGMDDDWVSDSSADIDPGTLSPSVRTRKQSVATAATSVEIRSVLGGVGEICLSPTSSLGREAASRAPAKGGRSWVDLDLDLDLDLDTQRTEADLDEGEGSVGAAGYPDASQAVSATRPSGNGHAEQPAHVHVPRRRSSLSHQVTTVSTEEATQVRVGHAPREVELEAASNMATPSLPFEPPPSLPQPYHTAVGWETNEAAPCQNAPNTCRQPGYEPRYALTATSSYQLRPPSPPPQEGLAHDALDSQQKPRHHPSLFHKLRKTQSHSRMPVVTQVQSWLDSSATTAHSVSSPHLTAHSPTAKAPVGSVRVAAEVLENLRISVGNFPDTMLRTSSLTVQTIRSYSRKLRRGGTISGDRGPGRDSDDFAFASLDGLESVAASADHKPSSGALALKKLSLRGKKMHLPSRQALSHGSPSPRDGDDLWPPADHHNLSMRSNTPPSRISSEVSACVGALRSIFPDGTDYLLDGLYAHLIAYNYMSSLCGAVPHRPGSHGGPALRSRPSLNLPPGVTSRAELDLHDRDDLAVRELHGDVAATASAAVVPKKAASLLGLGATYMGTPARPRPGAPAGRRDKHRWTAAPVATFSASLESETAMRDLRDAIASNIRRLVDTVKQSSPAAAGRDSDEDSEDAAVLGHNGREIDPTLLRSLCEVVRCYEEPS